MQGCASLLDKDQRATHWSRTLVQTMSANLRLVSASAQAARSWEQCAFFAGISLKTQQLYLLIFAMRYLDVLTSFISLCAPNAPTTIHQPAPAQHAQLRGNRKRC